MYFFSPNLGRLGAGYAVEHDLELLLLFLAPLPKHLHDKAWTTLPATMYFLLIFSFLKC